MLSARAAASVDMVATLEGNSSSSNTIGASKNLQPSFVLCVCYAGCTRALILPLSQGFDSTPFTEKQYTYGVELDPVVPSFVVPLGPRLRCRIKGQLRSKVS